METLIASAILSFVVASITYAIVAGQEVTYDSLHQLRATSLVEAMFEEVISKPYHDPLGAVAAGPDAGETSRALFNNADDYHNFNEVAGAVSDAGGVLYPGPFQVFSRSVTAVYGTDNVPELGGDVPGLSITVTVTDTRGRTWSSTQFIPEPA